MLHTLFSFLPFTVCLCWFLSFVLHYRQNDSAKRSFTWFIATCSVLYFCHALFFTVGLSQLMESLWMLCSLSVFPLYYIYICRLTSYAMSRRSWAIFFVPAGLVVLASLWFWAEADVARQILNSIQIAGVCWFGYRKLKQFDHEIAQVYADTEGRDTHSVRRLLIAFIATSLLAAMANIISKQSVAASDWGLVCMSLLFSSMLFLLCLMSHRRDFTIEQYRQDALEPEVPPCTASGQDDIDQLWAQIQNLMETEQFYLQPNLKIGDVAERLDTCRTYVSNCINRKQNCSFSDYVNRLRVLHSEQLRRQYPEAKILWILVQSGFSSEQSYYRNRKKFGEK